jgi:hypothetical protein
VIDRVQLLALVRWVIDPRDAAAKLETQMGVISEVAD